MALSGPTPMRVRVEGIPAARHLLRSIPGGIVTPTLEETLDDIVELGINLMSINILNTIRTDKSTGALADSVKGGWQRIGGIPGHPGGIYEAEIGSDLPYAGYASREIGLSTINANVLIQPGRWRWIGVRAPIPAHPFLEQTLEDLNKVMPDSLHGHFTRYIGYVQREVDGMAMFAWLERAPT